MTFIRSLFLGALSVAVTAGSALADNAFVRNDDAATVLNANDLDAGSAAVSQYGELYISSGTGTLNIAKAEDAASANGNVGVLGLSQRSGDITNSTSTDGDYANMKSDEAGRLYVNAWGNDPAQFYYAVSASDITNTTSTAVKAAVASYRIYVSAISCSNTSAVSSRLDLLDGATVIWTGHLPTAANGGQLLQSFNVPLRGTVNTALNVQLATTSTATRCAVNGFIAQN